jgi:hypothetical protein
MNRDTSDPDELTPVEWHGGLLVKRDDRFVIDGSRGGKVRSCLATARLGLNANPSLVGLVTAGARHSPQVNIVATVAARLGLRCRVHVPDGPQTPELAAAAATGETQVFRHRPGYNNVIACRARQDVETLGGVSGGWLEIPFGMECPAAVAQTARQCRNLRDRARAIDRIVVPLGSGMSLAGILAGTERIGGFRRPGLLWAETPVVAVAVGASADRRLDRWSAGWRGRVTVVNSGLSYNQLPAETKLEDLELDPIYEAKCLPFLRPGDLLWVVGRRATVGHP